MTDQEKIINNLGIAAKKAANELSLISEDEKNKALNNLKKKIKLISSELIEINKKDIENAYTLKLSSSMIDRLTLTKDRVSNMISSLDEIINLNDPVGNVLSEWDRPNGLHIKKISTPIGVIGIIFESRPNVTVDASAIAMKAGNAVILRGGKDSFFTSQKLSAAIRESFNSAGLPENTVQMVPIPDRSAVDEILKLDSYIDVIIPRGGKSLIEKIKEKSSIPVIKHLEGICHVYVDKDANLNVAKDVVFNSKMRRPGICGAAETLLIDSKISNQTMPIIEKLVNSKCEIRGDDFVLSLNNNFKQATEKDWETEYLDSVISVKIVDGVEGAIKHINRFSSGHTESIITENAETFKKFYNQINSAIILQNASTQFADGGEFGFGAEIGISTDKLHVRGPVGAEHLTSFKYVVHGNGQVRP
ncbi:MAG: Gamma-glutamyl phosphate reductase [Alphaproteobacteria bacterium MarineAlpha5_Bin6]|nr:MAG: Gamma-glutamyl phosphate reductase [Alphaproteobacteria bacterium MarineAlpha5_Bin7]PPR53755.1 MAG: Gamma-glutamyl phosphate reductase [Alphaproteobacteria bacterium MarineAlpha5_Bin6]|tara:strand:+ start:1170 stop:2426 length:1257 start_codon:yes stop_codon:yes gene_type:complete